MAGGFHVIFPLNSSKTLVSWMMAKSPSALRRRKENRHGGEGVCDRRSGMFMDTEYANKTENVYLL